MAILKEEKLKVKGWVKKDLVEIKSSKIYFGPIMFRVQNYLEATNFWVQKKFCLDMFGHKLTCPVMTHPVFT